MKEYLIKDIWGIVLEYLDGDIISYPKFFERVSSQFDRIGSNETIPIRFYENHLNSIDNNER